VKARGAGAEATYDVVIVGAGPAGCGAALRAAQLGARAAIVDQADFPRQRPCAGWLGPAAVKMCEEIGVSARDAGATVFRGVQLRSWDFLKHVDVADPDVSGWIVDRRTFDAQLVGRCEAAGVKLIRKAAPQSIRLGEEKVEVTLPQQPVFGRVLIAADGHGSPTARLVGMLPAGAGAQSAAGFFAPFDHKDKAASLQIAIGASRDGQVGVITRGAGSGRVAIVTRETRTPAADQARTFCAAAVKAGLLPAGVEAGLTPHACAAGAALDMDTHVGKRCLLVGDAGGFVSAFSGEGIYPAMRSGWLAAETAVRAIGSPYVQDELASFETLWRGELADYLRMPNTDLSLLMPLVFNNEQMSKRVARAFVLGVPF